MKIGIVGAGHIGGTIGQLLSRAGHQIRFGVRNPALLSELLSEIPGSAAGSASDAVRFGDAIFFAAPFHVWPEFALQNEKTLSGTTLIDTANPNTERDGPIAAEVRKSGRGSIAFTASLLPRSYVVKAFNTIHWADLRDKARRPGERLAMPIAGQDANGIAIAKLLAKDAGFDPIVLEGEDGFRQLDPGSLIYAKSYTATQIRTTLNL